MADSSELIVLLWAPAAFSRPEVIPAASITTDIIWAGQTTDVGGGLSVAK